MDVSTVSSASDWETPSTSITSPSMIYYRIYTPECAVFTKRPAFLDSEYIGSIRSTWLMPPRNARSVRQFLSNLENIDPSQTSLYCSRLRSSALDDKSLIFLEDGTPYGAKPEDPLILFSQVSPQQQMTPGTELFVIKPDTYSPFGPQFRTLLWLIFSLSRPI